MKKVLLTLSASLFLCLGIAMAQQTRTISGIVTMKSDGSPLPGVNIVLKGTQIGTVTDVDGKYTLNVPESGGTLIFSYIGMKQEEVEIGNQNQINVGMASNTEQLNDVVVVGYGSQIKKDMTGNISSVSGKDIQNVPVPNFESAIEGRNAGVFIQQNNGKLGQAMEIRIRGASSVSASNQPLVVIDGVPVTSSNQSSGFNGTGSGTNPLSDLNFADIQSINILKDASAAAIYGSRASNGVIIITTKDGQAGKTQFNVKYSQGFSSPTGKRKFMNGTQYSSYFLEAAKNAATYFNDGFDYVGYVTSHFKKYSLGTWPNNPVNVNWVNQAFNKNAGFKNLEISASGGNKKTTFYASGNYSNTTGIVIENYLQRISGRLNIDHKANDKVTIGAKINVIKTTNQRVPDDDAFSTPVQLLAQPPIQPLRDSLGNYISDNSLYFNGLLYKNNALFPVNSFHTYANAYGQYNITQHLMYRSEFGLDLYDQNEQRWFGSKVARNTGYSNGDALSTWDRVVNYTLNNYAEYQNTFNSIHDIDAVAGISYQRSNQNQTYVEGVGYPSDQFRQIISAAQIIGGNTQATAFSFLSYFARANYKLKDRYLLSLSGRVDGSSRFGKDHRYGFFPAASAGWILTQEHFLRDSPIVSFLKLRASYGITGNAAGINNFAPLGLYSGTSYAGVSGTNPSQTPNPNLKWEQTAQTDIGIDYGFFDQRINGSVDYYFKKTKDLLLNVNVPATTGFTTQIRNVGKLQNKGIEVVINSVNLLGEFFWSTNFNFAANQNKITNLNGQVITGGYINRAMEGQPIGVFYAQEFAGANPANGDALYYLNRTPTQQEISDGTAFKVKNMYGGKYVTNNYDAAQRVVLGNPNPKFTAGLTNNFSYKGFNLSFMFYMVYGNKIYNGGGAYMSASGNYFDNQTIDQLNAWQKPGDVTMVPQARLFASNGTGDSSRYLDDGTYLRLKNLSLSYELPKGVLKSLNGMREVKIFVTGQNLLTFTKYKGFDPEVNTDYLAGNISLGNDFYSAPQARTISFGINLGF